ncbi:MAG: protein kinase [Burkholderiales bacterium]
MTHDYVRICPVCERENEPAQARCLCGASLVGVDFTLKTAPLPPAVEEVALVAEAVTAAADATPAVAAQAVATAPEPAPRAPTLPSVICPFADCGQSNPAGSERCVYCNRPLAHASSAAASARPLPSALRAAYRVVDVFPATGSEADILLVADAATGERRVAKLYRRGIEPDFRLLDILTQSVGDAVVRVLAHGVSDGVAYELLEYVPGGTLEDLITSGPLPKSDIRRMVQELADALAGIHAQRILHRDLKPDNVLVRSRSPLSLALTDFGIASFTAATLHFTNTARTTKYAAPEALTGVLDPKADWWSLGMIVLEAASGRHPFDGLTEPVMNYQLATRPIDVSGVYDDELRTLCRGLLLRDPKQRWGREEVSRWLDGDETLMAPVESATAAGSVRPYRFGKTEATTVHELALALARHWDAARRDVARGQVARWIEQELFDYNLLRTLRDIQDQKALSDDGKLLRFLLAAAPELPPVWRGSPVSRDAILAAARAAAGDDDDAQAWLDSLMRDEVLETYGAAGHGALAVLGQKWRDALQRFTGYWEIGQKAEAMWRKTPRGEHAAASFDDLVYGPASRLDMPAPRDLHGPLLLVQNDDAYAAALRERVATAVAELGGRVGWFDAVWENTRDDAVGVVAAFALLAQAKEDAAAEARREQAEEEAIAQEFASARNAVRTRLTELLGLVPSGDEDLNAPTVGRLHDAFATFQAACQHLLALPAAGEEHETLRRAVERLSAQGFATQRALAATEATSGMNEVLLSPRVLAPVGVGLLLILVRVPMVLLVVAAFAALAIGYRWYTGFHATEQALERLRVFGLSARSFLRGPGSTPDEGPTTI